MKACFHKKQKERGENKQSKEQRSTSNLMKACFHKKQKERGENKQSKEQRSTSSNFALITVSSDIDSQASQHMCRDEKLFKWFDDEGRWYR
ncbi:hypothetical protein QE152_g33262 [Popillia japonica]|uniref:Uncharacterized protein n=1 Tax=Popillia japonica TaxID=7064 RepID=A0AAW1IXF1_POPJA